MTTGSPFRCLYPNTSPLSSWFYSTHKGCSRLFFRLSVLKCRVCACVWHTVPSAHTLDVVQIHKWSVAASSDRTVAYHGAGFTHVDFEGWTDSVSWLYLTRLKGHFTQIRENLSSSFPLTPKNLERKSANNEYILFFKLRVMWPCTCAFLSISSCYLSDEPIFPCYSSTPTHLHYVPVSVCVGFCFCFVSFACACPDQTPMCVIQLYCVGGRPANSVVVEFWFFFVCFLS